MILEYFTEFIGFVFQYSLLIAGVDSWNSIRDFSLLKFIVKPGFHMIATIRLPKFFKSNTNFLSLIQVFKYIIALFNNMRTLKFKSQPTNAFFATVNQMFGDSSQLPTTADRAVIKSNRRVQFRQHSRKLGGAAEHLIDGSEKRICRLSFEF